MTNSVVPRGDPRRAVAYVRVGETSASEEAQRAAIVAWAARMGVSIEAWHVSHGPTSEPEIALAALAALPSCQAGWFVVASLDRLYPDVDAAANLFGSMAHEKGAKLRSADGACDPGPGQQCPICLDPIHPWPRYPRALCGLCMREATDERGRLLNFYNIDMSGGFRAVYADTGETRAGHICYVRGVRCWADEARFGGIVIEARP